MFMVMCGLRNKSNLPAGSKLKLHNGAILNMNYDNNLYINGTLTYRYSIGHINYYWGSIIFEGSSSSGSAI